MSTPEVSSTNWAGYVQKIACETYYEKDLREALGYERDNELLCDTAAPSIKDQETMTAGEILKAKGKLLAKLVAFHALNAIRPSWNIASSIDSVVICISQLPFFLTGTLNSTLGKISTLVVSGLAIVTKPILVAAILSVKVVVGLVRLIATAFFKILSKGLRISLRLISNYVVAPIWNHTIGALINKVSVIFYNRKERKFLKEQMVTLSTLHQKLNVNINFLKTQQQDSIVDESQLLIQLEEENEITIKLMDEIKTRANEINLKTDDIELINLSDSFQNSEDILIEARNTNSSIAEVLSSLTGKSENLEIAQLKKENEDLEEEIALINVDLNDKNKVINKMKKDKNIAQNERDETIKSNKSSIVVLKYQKAIKKQDIKENNLQIKNLEKQREKLRRQTINNHQNRPIHSEIPILDMEPKLI